MRHATRGMKAGGVMPAAGWRLLPLALLAAALLAAVLWPRGPDLVPWISPPLDASGVRLHMLVPRGWVLRFHPSQRAQDAPPGDADGLIKVTPPEPWLPLPLRRWLPHPNKAGANLTLAFVRSPRRLDTPDYYDTAIGAQDMAGRTMLWLATGVRPSPDGWYVSMNYYRGSKATLDRTAPAILRSLRVER